MNKHEIRCIDSAGALLTQSELMKRISERMAGIIAESHRAKARKDGDRRCRQTLAVEGLLTKAPQKANDLQNGRMNAARRR